MEQSPPATTNPAVDSHPLFSGLIVPMLTPLTAGEDLDRESMERLTEFVIDKGADGLFILGSNGEGAMLRSSTRRDVAVAAISGAAGRVPVIAGVLETSTARVIHEIQMLEDLDLDGYVVTTPLYFDGFDDEELYLHFLAIADAATRPILVYNIPQFASTAISAGLVRRLAALPNVVGLKDSSGNWGQFEGLLVDPPGRGFSLLQGNHADCAASLLGGADGLVPGYANLFPDLFVEMIAAAREGRSDRCAELQANLNTLLSFRGRANLHANKVVANAMGIMDDHVTSPMPRLDAASAAQLLADTVQAGLPGVNR